MNVTPGFTRLFSANPAPNLELGSERAPHDAFDAHVDRLEAVQHDVGFDDHGVAELHLGRRAAYALELDAGHAARTSPSSRRARARS